MQCHFKVDAAEHLWLLWASALRLRTDTAKVPRPPRRAPVEAAVGSRTPSPPPRVDAAVSPSRQSRAAAAAAASVAASALGLSSAAAAAAAAAAERATVSGQSAASVAAAAAAAASASGSGIDLSELFNATWRQEMRASLRTKRESGLLLTGDEVQLDEKLLSHFEAEYHAAAAAHVAEPVAVEPAAAIGGRRASVDREPSPQPDAPKHPESTRRASGSSGASDCPAGLARAVSTLSLRARRSSFSDAAPLSHGALHEPPPTKCTPLDLAHTFKLPDHLLAGAPRGGVGVSACACCGGRVGGVVHMLSYKTLMRADGARARVARARRAAVARLPQGLWRRAGHAGARGDCRPGRRGPRGDAIQVWRVRRPANRRGLFTRLAPRRRPERHTRAHRRGKPSALARAVRLAAARPGLPR